MGTETKSAGVDPEVLADLDTVMRHLIEKTPMKPELLERVEKRANRATEELRRKNLHIDIEKLLHDARNES